MDVEAPSRGELAVNLADMALANRLLGTAGHLAGCLETLWPDDGREDAMTWLDLGSGQGDVALAVLTWAGRKGRKLRAMVSDVSEAALDIAVEHLSQGGVQDVAALRLDACALPFADESVDFVTCCHLLHHLSGEQVIALLREMERVSRSGFVALDLRRSLATYWASRLLTMALGPGHRLSRHDGPLSALRSFTCGELKEIAVGAGIAAPEVRHYAWQIALVGRKGPSSGAVN